MKKPIIYMAALTAMAAASCTAIETNSQNRDDDAITQTENESPYYISLEQALISLDEFFQNTTKSSRSYTISDAFTVNNPSSTKLSAEENPTLLHIVNFEGEEGYAILSADIRIPSTVLAVTEKGSLTSDSFVTDTSAEFSPAIIVYRSAAAAVGDAPGGFDKPDSVTFDPPELEEGETEMTIIRWKAWEDIKRRFRLHGGNAVNGVKRIIYEFSLFIHTPAGAQQLVRALITAERRLNDGLSRHVGTQTHVGKHVDARDVV